MYMNMYMFMCIGMYTIYIYIYMENGTNGKGNFRLFAANFRLTWSANDKQ